MNENLTSTKFIMSSVCLVMVFIAFMAGKINAQDFMPFVLGILGLYQTSNVIAKFSDKKTAD